MKNEGLWHIRNRIFEHLDHNTVEVCRQVSDFWGESLERISLVKYLKEFVDRKIFYSDESFSYHLAFKRGQKWEIALKKFETQTRLETLRSMKNSLERIFERFGRVDRIETSDEELKETLVLYSIPVSYEVEYGLKTTCAVS